MLYLIVSFINRPPNDCYIIMFISLDECCAFFVTMDRIFLTRNQMQ